MVLSINDFNPNDMFRLTFNTLILFDNKPYIKQLEIFFI